MLLLRRIIALSLLASFAGSQPASAGCSMAAGADDDAVATRTMSMHEHHHSDDGASIDESEPMHGSTHSGTAPDCGLLMACAVAAPAAAATTVPAAPFGSAPSAITPASAYASPSLAFEPPPPRQNLI
jgi:hypothetical protein